MAAVGPRDRSIGRCRAEGPRHDWVCPATAGRTPRVRCATVSAATGIDVGPSAVKAIAVSADGEVLARREVAYPISTPRPGWSEQDPEDWWRATEQALDGLGEGGISGVGLSGQMHGAVAWGAADAVIRPAILWNDQRTQAECDEIEALVGLDRLIELTGNRALPGFTAPKLLLLRE